MILESGGVLLVIGYVIRFLSQAYAALKPAFLRIDSRQVDSALILGGDTMATMAHCDVSSD